MQRYSILTYRKTQFCQDVTSSQIELQIQCNSSQNPSKLFCRYQQIDFKFTRTVKRPRILYTILKENKVGRLILPDFMSYYKAIEIKTVWYWQKNRRTDQWNRIENLETDLYYIYNKLIFNKGVKTVKQR